MHFVFLLIRKYLIEWCEDHNQAELAPMHVKLPKELLKPGLVVNIIRMGETNYDDVILFEFHDNGNHIYRSKHDGSLITYLVIFGLRDPHIALSTTLF